MSDVKTVFGSLQSYQKGGIQVINDDPKNYVFSNVFDVATRSKPYERVAVGKNFEYVIECVRAEGTSPWFATAHDEFALCMDGKVEVRLLKLDDPGVVPAGKNGAIRLAGHDDLWRLRAGEYRIIYAIDGGALVVLVIRVGHRREIYRKLD